MAYYVDLNVTMIEFNAYGGTDCGTERENNEDAFIVDEERGLFIIADGLGGLPGGEVASEMVVSELGKFLKDGGELDFQKQFESIREMVNKKGEEFEGDLGIASTLTVGVLRGKTLKVGHVGDSGILVFRRGKFHKLTTDHTMAQGMKEKARPGDRDYIPPYFNNVLTQFIGKLSKLKVEVVECDLRKEDCLLFYTDGVTKALSNEELLAMSEDYDTPKALVNAIIAKAEKRGGVDNVTAIAVYII